MPRVHVLVERAGPWDAARLAAFFEACGPARYGARGAPVTAQDRARWVAAAEAAGFHQAYQWDLAGPAGPLRAGVALQAQGFTVRAVDPARWLHLAFETPLASAAEIEWLVGYLARLDAATGGVLFAFADTDHHLEANRNADPRKLVWPVTLLGPEHVARLTPERVRAAHALVREVPPASVLLALGESPLAARARALDALARHLGRPARR